MNNLALIDGDLFPYMVGFACQKSTYSIIGPRGGVKRKGLSPKGEAIKKLEDYPNCTLQEDIKVQKASAATNTVDVMIRDILKGSKCTAYKVYLTGEGNYRENIATLRKYKGNRDGIAKPVLYDDIKHHLLENHGAQICDGIEADDAVSIVQMKYRAKGARSVIATIDKDLNGTPGLHYNFFPNYKGERLFDVSEEEALYFFYKQVLTGDLATDNIQGLPGVGDKKAEKILDGVPLIEKDLYAAVLEAYNKYYDKQPSEYYHWNDALEENPLVCTGEIMLIENARLVYMMREPAQKPINLWYPPGE
jgi:hypothetical protein